MDSGTGIRSDRHASRKAGTGGRAGIGKAGEQLVLMAGWHARAQTNVYTYEHLCFGFSVNASLLFCISGVPPMVQVEVVSQGKAAVVKGNTKPIKNLMKELGGKWRVGLNGWLYPGSKHPEIIERLKKDGHTVDDRFQSLDETASNPDQPSTSGFPRDSIKKRKHDEAEDVGRDIKRRVSFAIGDDNKQVTVSENNKKLYVNIENWFMRYSRGAARPSCIGIGLTMDNFEALKKAMPLIEAEVQKKKAQLDKGGHKRELKED